MTSAAITNLRPTRDPDLGTEGLPAYAAWRTIGSAALVVLLSTLLGAFVCVAVNVIRRRFGHGLAPLGPVYQMMLVAIPAQLGCIGMVVARARHLGGGDLVRGFSAGPIPRSKLFALLAFLEIAAVIYYSALLILSPAYVHQIRGGLHEPLIAAARGGSLWLTIYLFQLTILSPVSEELLFRGWLWTVLRRSWGVWPTAVCTGGAWWALHAVLGLATLPSLLPFAVIYSLVRHSTGTVRATVALHVLHNARLAILTLVALLVS